MKFGHKHYVPILKGKRAEFAALGSLNYKTGITPLMESVPSLEADLLPQRMAACWPTESPYFIDLRFLDDPDDDVTPAGEDHPVLVCFEEADQQGQLAIPVTALSRSPGYQSAVRRVVAEQQNGVALRLTSDDFEDADDLETVLESFASFFGLEPAETDLILDLGSVADSSAGVVAQMHRAHIDLIPHINAWRTLTVAAGAFPLRLGPMLRNQWNPSNRHDWRGWRSIVGGPHPAVRLPSFADYAIAHPGLPPEGRATILAQLRYTTANTWLTWKGYNAFTHGFEQFFAICASMMEHPEYRGPGFSWGDAEIQRKATNADSPGNAETWRRIGTNHHLETVLEQIASLP